MSKTKSDGVKKKVNNSIPSTGLKLPVFTLNVVAAPLNGPLDGTWVAAARRLLTTTLAQLMLTLQAMFTDTGCLKKFQVGTKESQ